jgi:diacylglycerol O-acyltransferase / wax synthase
MSERLSPRDLALLALDSPSSPLSHATVEVFDPGESGLDHEALVSLVTDRIAFVPRYRQRLAFVPLAQGRPKWVDDPHFNLRYHVRSTALASPGSERQLKDLAGRVFSQQLDRDKPLWEVWSIGSKG